MKCPDRISHGHEHAQPSVSSGALIDAYASGKRSSSTTNALIAAEKLPAYAESPSDARSTRRSAYAVFAS